MFSIQRTERRSCTAQANTNSY